MNRRAFIHTIGTGIVGVSLYPADFLGRSQVSVVTGVHKVNVSFPELLDASLRKIFFDTMMDKPPDYGSWLEVRDNTLMVVK